MLKVTLLLYYIRDVVTVGTITPTVYEDCHVDAHSGFAPTVLHRGWNLHLHFWTGNDAPVCRKTYLHFHSNDDWVEVCTQGFVKYKPCQGQGTQPEIKNKCSF